MAARTLKYIIGQSASGMPTPIIFPEWLDHSEFARFQPTSAGIVQIYPHETAAGKVEAVCFGESHTLEIDSDPADSQTITRLLNRKEW